jgi:hypothetical protein
MQYLHSLEIEDFQCFTSIVHSSFESTNGEKKANVLDEACDKKNPSTVPKILFLEALPLPQIGRKGIEWDNYASKWSYKVSEYIKIYATKWLLTPHLKKVYKFIIEKKGNHECPSTQEGGI